MDMKDRYRGSLVGLAVGDALGTTVEFKRPGTFEPVTDITGGGPFGLAPGEWTDDTSMALCLAASLLEQQGFDPNDQIQRYVRWYREGYFSCTGMARLCVWRPSRCFMVRSPLRQFIFLLKAHLRPMGPWLL